MSEAFLNGRIILHAGDCLDVLATLPENSVDSVVCDPPYGLQFMGRGWDHSVPGIPYWINVLRVLKPGGHLVAFSGTRTYHRMACAIEDSGFEIRDCLQWLYGSGFPKSHDVSKGIDKRRVEDEEPVRHICRAIRAAMDAREIKSRHLVECFDNCHPRLIDHWAARDTDSQPALPTWPQWLTLKSSLGMTDELDNEVWRLNGRKGTPGMAWNDREITGEVEEWTDRTNYAFTSRDGLRRDIPATDSAREWQGWGTSLKPSQEPIAFCTKPLPLDAVFGIVLHDFSLRLWRALCQKSLASAPDAEAHLRSFLLSCERAGVSSVVDHARTSALESPERAIIAAARSTWRAHTSKRETESTVAETARRNGNESIQSEAAIQTTVVGATSYAPVISELLSGRTNIDLSIFLLWKSISEDVLQRAKTFTTETALEQITALRTLSCLLSQSTLDSTLESGKRSPNCEPICLARKPLSEKTVAANVLKWGTGAINVDGCRVGIDDVADPSRLQRQQSNRVTWEGGEASGFKDDHVQPLYSTKGRWPANLLLSYPEDEYELKWGATPEQKRELFGWLHANT